MENKQEYRDNLRAVIGKLHNCGAVWRETVPVTEVFQGRTIWEGEVEVFDLPNHPKAKRAYAWSYKTADEEKFIAVLEIPPVDSPQSAVKVAIAAEVKGTKK